MFNLLGYNLDENTRMVGKPKSPLGTMQEDIDVNPQEVLDSARSERLKKVDQTDPMQVMASMRTAAPPQQEQGGGIDKNMLLQLAQSIAGGMGGMPGGAPTGGATPAPTPTPEAAASAMPIPTGAPEASAEATPAASKDELHGMAQELGRGGSKDQLLAMAQELGGVTQQSSVEGTKPTVAEDKKGMLSGAMDFLKENPEVVSQALGQLAMALSGGDQSSVGYQLGALGSHMGGGMGELKRQQKLASPDASIQEMEYKDVFGLGAEGVKGLALQPNQQKALEAKTMETQASTRLKNIQTEKLGDAPTWMEEAAINHTLKIDQMRTKAGLDWKPNIQKITTAGGHDEYGFFDKENNWETFAENPNLRDINASMQSTIDTLSLQELMPAIERLPEMQGIMDDFTDPLSGRVDAGSVMAKIPDTPGGMELRDLWKELRAQKSLEFRVSGGFLEQTGEVVPPSISKKGVKKISRDSYGKPVVNGV